ncbi:leukocyte receptor cluster member 9 [Salarias fasciatus]|uniref:C3H1-type domain-containing protein n=1 Tax=Salarias fasciatus TaxID=181472 RepID=A0A672HTP9_SALFA|nr:leukocyte receptor cluster member 9 [Salarias fasciatus]
MASAGPPDGSSDLSGDQRDGVTHMTPTSLSDSPGTEVRVPADCDTPRTTGESAEGHESAAKVCQFFRMKKCRFGDNCRLLHSDPVPDDSGAVSPDTDDKPDEEKTEKQKKKKGTGGKATKPKYSERREVNKKPRMRTADDVISRILWDSVDSSEFVVGYVDRFLGVLERPFNEFNWDTNPCDCDYSSELALPRHRIQYFAYRGHRVWDRHTRTDRVFGSTGQSLAPPFGKEEEVEGTNAGNHEQQQRDLEPREGLDDGEGEERAHTQNTHLEEEVDAQSTDPTDLASESGNACQEQQESRGPGVVENSETRCKTSTDPKGSPQKGEPSGKEELEDQTAAGQDGSWEAGEDFAAQLGPPQTSEGASPLEQREEKPGGKRPKKQPTHFVTFKANTPAILSSFQQLQKEVCALLPSSAPHWQTASSLHVTMCLLVLRGPEEVSAAAEILTQFAHLDRNPPVAVTFPVKLKHFNGRVLYLSPHPQLSLQQLNSGLQEAYRKEGLLHRKSYNPRYHLTLAKVKDWDGERVFEGVWDLKVGKGLNFGRLPVNTLHLCVVGDDKADGFNEILHTVTLR